MSEMEPGLYKDKYYFYYRTQHINKRDEYEWCWYQLNPLFPNRSWVDCWGVATHNLTESSALEFLVRTGVPLDAASLEEEHARRVAQRATRRKKSKKGKKNEK